MRNIFLIGAGQVGSRHLQALRIMPEAVAIHVIDPSAESLATAEQRWNEMEASAGADHTCHFHTALADAPHAPVDLAIVATNSFHRRSTVESLLGSRSVGALLLEKFLFPEEEDFLSIGSLLKQKAVPTWVNLPRRMAVEYQGLRELFQGSQSFHLRASGSGIGLGSNAIHYLDLAMFLGGTTVDSVQLQNVEPKVYESRRSGYVEFAGSAFFGLNKGSCEVTSLQGDESPFLLTIQAESVSAIISESKGKMSVFRKENAWAEEERTLQLRYQSNMTNEFAQAVFTGSAVWLPTYEETAPVQLEILKAFTAKQIEIQGELPKGGCKIT